MANQYLAYHEETTRGVTPGSPARKFLPVTKGLAPKFSPKDEPRKEFKGQDTALGDASVVRRESQYTVSLESLLYPGVETGMLLKHLMGFAGSRTVTDTTAYQGILYPKAMPYGSGQALVDTAIGLVPNIDRDGTTKSQIYAGTRFKSASLNIKPPDDVTISLEGQGAGPWVGSPNQAAIAGATFPAASPLHYGMATFYIGAGATRTGTGPDFTAIAPNTMAAFTPDDMTIKITNGLDDTTICNGVLGPTKTERTGQFAVDIDFSVDFRDPAAGFSSLDEFEAMFASPRTTSLMVVLTSTELAGSSTAYYKYIFDLPLVLLTAEAPEPSNDGKQVKVKFTGKGLLNSTVGYPLAIWTVDKATTY